MMKRLYKLPPEERACTKARLVTALAANPKVLFAYLYGSFVEAAPFHDVDVGVYLAAYEESGSAVFALDLTQHMSEQLQLPVDVRILNAAPVSFLYHVFKGELLFARDEERLAVVIEETARQYCDISPLLRRSTKEAFDGSER